LQNSSARPAGALVAAEEAGSQLSEDELLTTAALLFAAGFETTTNLLRSAELHHQEWPIPRNAYSI